MRRSAGWLVGLVALWVLGCGGSDDAIGASGGDGTDDTGGADGGDFGLPGPGWAQRRALTLPDDVLGLGLTNIPLLVRVDASRIAYEVTNEFTPDVRFYDGALEAEIPFEVERWIEDGESLFWIRPAVIDDSPAGRSIYMYYGNSHAGGGPAPEEVFSDGYLGVWHMAQAGDGSVPDSSGHGNVGTLFGGGADIGTGSIGGPALSISAGASYLEVASDASLDAGQSLTIEGWVDPDGVDDKARFLVRKRDAYAIESVSEGDGTPRGVVWFQDSADRAVTSDAPLENGWTHLAIVYDGPSGAFELYRDGVLDQTRAPPTDPAVPSDTSIEIGLESYGLVDEVRVSGMARSAAWIEVQHRAMRDELFAFGEPETP